MNPKYLRYRNRMISQGKEYLSLKEWEASQGGTPKKKKKKKSDNGGPCFVGTVIPKDW